MKAALIEKSRTVIDDTTFFEAVLWHLPAPVPGSGHPFKYRLALVVNGECVLRYDNERGKGDHRHIGGIVNAELKFPRSAEVKFPTFTGPVISRVQ